MSSSVLQPGSVFAGRYRVEKCIAEGGMGAVYEVLHTETGRRHALKVMHAHTLSSAELRDRFRQEARVAANVQSEFIVDVLDAGVETATNLPFLVMELLQGEELGKLLQRRVRFTPAETVTFLGQVAMALDKTHRAMIVHRDLKPENLFLTQREDGTPRVKVLDFGVAKIVAETNTNAAATRSLGTPLYMAPEQFQPGNRVSPSTDLFALALIAYTFLVGRSYWAEEATEAANVFSFALTAIHGPREGACARAARAGVALPAAFDAWFSRAAHTDPSMRFSHATAMIRALGEALGVGVPFRSTAGDPLGGSGSNPAFALPTGSNPAFALPAGTGANPALAQPTGSGSTPGFGGAGRPATPAFGVSGPQVTSAMGPPALGVSQAPTISARTPQSLQGTSPSAPFQDTSSRTLASPSPLQPSPLPLHSSPSPSPLQPLPLQPPPQQPLPSPSPQLTLSGAPTVVGYSPIQSNTTGGLSTTGPVAPSGVGKKVVLGAIGSLLLGFVVAAIVLIPRGDAASGLSGAGAGSTASAADTAPPSAPATSSPTTDLPTADLPTAAPSTAASATEAPSASAPPSSEPTSTKAPGVKPKPKGPKPPGTSVYIRD